MKLRSLPLRSLAAVIALLALAACQKDLQFTLTFHDARGIRAGAPLTHDATKIGEVTSVVVDASSKLALVAIRVDANRRKDVYREASFTIVRRDLFGPATGERLVMMEDRGDARTPIANGDVIEGAEQPVDKTLQGITNAVDAARKAVDDSFKKRAEEKGDGNQ